MEDCVKIDLAGVGGKNESYRDRGEWRRVIETAVKRDE